MTSPSPLEPGRPANSALAAVEAALADGRVSAAEPEGRTIQSFALALRDAQPRPRPPFVAQLDRWMRDQTSRSGEATAGPAASEIPRRAIRVCVAVRHPLLREGMARALERDSDIEVVGEADDAGAALELARRLRPDVMVLDLSLPGTGGTAALKRLQSELPQVRAVVREAHGSVASLLDALAAGAAGYLSTRATGEELRQAVITVHGGGGFISPDFDHLLLSELDARRAEGESVCARLQLAGRKLEIVQHLAERRPEEATRGRPAGEGTPARNDWGRWWQRPWGALRRWCAR